MKKLRIVLVSLIALLFSACQPKVDMEREKEAVKSVIQQEVDAFIAKDMNKLAGLYVQDELNTRLQETCSLEHPIYSGWKNVNSFLDTLMKQTGPGYTNMKNSKEDFIIKIKGDCAWVINKDKWSWEDSGKPFEGYGIQTTYMEKINGSWKISMMACYYRDQASDETKSTETIK
jgi:ketosteroid isomerase-like protein